MINARILVVDDDAESRALVRAALPSVEGFCVLEAGDGGEALERREQPSTPTSSCST